MRFLADVLDGALQASEAVLEQVRNPDYVGVRASETWLLGIAFIITLLDRHGFSIFREDPKGKRHMLPGGIALIEEIQNAAPEATRIRRTRASLKKGIEDALRLTEEEQARDMSSLLLFASLFDFDLGPSKGPPSFTDKVNGP